MKLTILREAELESAEAAAWYDDRRVELGDEFLSEVTEAVAKIGRQRSAIILAARILFWTLRSAPLRFEPVSLFGRVHLSSGRNTGGRHYARASPTTVLAGTTRIETASEVQSDSPAASGRANRHKDREA